VLREHRNELRLGLAGLRREAIALRRYLAPQREVVTRLTMSQAPWLGARDRAVLREVADRTTRFVEDLDAARERAAVVQDELNTRLSDQMNRTMYLLTLVATVLLPPSLITGLLGVNVGGIPGSDQAWAFWAVLVLLLLLAGVEIAVLRRLRWI
jgi:zinc transporter